MSELQGPRIPGEERSRRRGPLDWIIGGLIALLLLALLVPFACQALGGGSNQRGESSSGSQQEKTGAQGAAGAGGGETTSGSGNAAGEATTRTSQSTGKGTERTSGERAVSQGGERLPESGGIPPAALLAIGTLLLPAGGVGLSAAVRRCRGNGG